MPTETCNWHRRRLQHAHRRGVRSRFRRLHDLRRRLQRREPEHQPGARARSATASTTTATHFADEGFDTTPMGDTPARATATTTAPPSTRAATEICNSDRRRLRQPWSTRDFDLWTSDGPHDLRRRLQRRRPGDQPERERDLQRHRRQLRHRGSTRASTRLRQLTTCGGDCDDADPAVNPGASRDLQPHRRQLRHADRRRLRHVDSATDSHDLQRRLRRLRSPRQSRHSAAEVCNGIDDNCNTLADERLRRRHRTDSRSCSGDCNDSGPRHHPGRPRPATHRRQLRRH